MLNEIEQEIAFFRKRREQRRERNHARPTKGAPNSALGDERWNLDPRTLSTQEAVIKMKELGVKSSHEHLTLAVLCGLVARPKRARINRFRWTDDEVLDAAERLTTIAMGGVLEPETHHSEPVADHPEARGVFAMHVSIDADDLRPVVALVLEELLAKKASFTTLMPAERLGYREAEAAALIGVRPHVLRDARLRGEIRGRKVGKKTVYSRQELLRFLESE